MSQNDLRVHFGLGKNLDQVNRLEVSWPSGKIDKLKNVELDTIIHIKEGIGQIGK